MSETKTEVWRVVDSPAPGLWRAVGPWRSEVVREAHRRCRVRQPRGGIARRIL